MDERKILVKRLAASLAIGLLLTICLCAALDKGNPISVVGSPALADNKSANDEYPVPLMTCVVRNIEFTPIDGGWHVSWEARLPGDYSRDGEVSIADITPIAMHYGEEVAGDPYLRVIDGAINDVIDIADVTRIAEFHGTNLVQFEMLLGDHTLGPWRSVGLVPWQNHAVPLVGWPMYEADISVEPGERRFWVKILVEPSNDHLCDKTEFLPGEA